MGACNSVAFNVLCAVTHASFAILLALDDATSKPSMFPLVRVYSDLIAFSIITSCFHLFYAVNLGRYDPAIRFAEYSVTAALMAEVIALLVRFQGDEDVSYVAVLTSVTMLFGYLEEKTTAVPLMFRPHYLGYVPFLAAWYYLTSWFAEAENVPDFVVAIFVVEFCLFSCFGLVQYMYVVRRGARRPDGEMDGVYNLLSLIAKTMLVMLCYGGVKAQAG